MSASNCLRSNASSITFRKWYQQRFAALWSLRLYCISLTHGIGIGVLPQGTASPANPAFVHLIDPLHVVLVNVGHRIVDCFLNCFLNRGAHGPTVLLIVSRIAELVRHGSSCKLPLGDGLTQKAQFSGLSSSDPRFLLLRRFANFSSFSFHSLCFFACNFHVLLFFESFASGFFRCFPSFSWSSNKSVRFDGTVQSGVPLSNLSGPSVFR